MRGTATNSICGPASSTSLNFLKLNPRGVVPVLVHDGNVIIESNIIMEYLEDTFSDTKRLMPQAPQRRAAVRNLLQRLDTSLHLHIATISVGIAFRDQLLAVHNSDEALESYYAAMPDPRLQAVYRDVVPSGASSKSFLQALDGWKRQLADMNNMLASNNWLVGDHPTLADFAYLPYMCRFEHLHMTEIWSRYPALTSWFERCKQTAGYRKGIEAWLNPKYLELMKERGLATKANLRGLPDPPVQANIAA
ncbi:MAG: glutathione S-transferase family protein [Xanthobacteraceae bacterium]